MMIAVSAVVRRDNPPASLRMLANIIPSIQALEFIEIIVFFFVKEFSGWEKKVPAGTKLLLRLNYLTGGTQP